MSFSFLERGYGDKLVEYTAHKSITFPERTGGSDDIVGLVSEAVRKSFLVKGLDEKMERQVDYITGESEIENLMEGSLHLINLLIEKGIKGEPVQTLLFLDKSARNGAFIMRRLWSELERRGEIPVGTSMPEIRFMNIGLRDDEKHSNEAPIFLAKQKYKKEDFESKRVLVVDEFVSSGSSLRRALKLIEDLYGVSPAGVANFKHLPDWYGNKKLGILGVTDMEDAPGRWTEVKNALDKMQIPQAKLLWEMTRKFDKDRFSDILSKFHYWMDRKANVQTIYKCVNEKEKLNLSTVEVGQLCGLIKSAELSVGDGGDVWQYVDSAGGFTSRRLESENLTKNGFYYRKVLKAIVSTYMAERDLRHVSK